MSPEPVTPRPGPHHASPPEYVLGTLGVDPRKGLTSAEARARAELHGLNALPESARRGAFERFLLQFHDILIYVLLAAGAITAVLGHWIDSGVIFGVVIINAIIGFVQEGKAEHALDAIRNMLSPRAQVLRDGHRRELPAEELVPGDIVFLVSGDKVPADLRLVDVRSLRVEEAALTGESVPVDKAPDAVGRDVPLGDRSSMAYSGTLVAYGQASGVVVATGAKTEIGRISEMLGAVEELSTPLLRQLAAFGRTLTWVILAVAGFTFAFGTLLRDYSVGEMFLAAVGLAVAAIPEGLPAIMTITLAIGVQRMAARNAIIRRLPSVEALGSVTVICSDKTGTLTRNEMTVQRVACADRSYLVTGSGYAPHGGFEEGVGGESRTVEPDGALLEAARVALLCNDASVRREGGDWTLAGDPTEGALIVMAMKAGLELEFEREALPRTDVIPFESEHRFMATLHHDHEGRGRIYLKGAPERVLELCARQRTDEGDTAIDPEYWHARMHEIAADGMRLLAVAVREGEDATRELRFADVEQGGFTLLALFGLSDPPREEAIEAVARCRAAGIRVKMITGDHAATARAIGVRLGLDEHVQAVTGSDIDAMDDTTLAQAALDNEVFARASPEHKLRLVTALQSLGEVVAMTGDGVNDAPALKRAEVGVAMGNKGTEAAKEAAEVVLADDNFASIAAAVEEGRTVYDNLRKAIAFILPTNLGQGGIVLFAVLFGITMPITPAQILWVNMITAVTLALALAFERPERDIMGRAPRAQDASLLDRFVLWRIFFVGALLVAGGLGFFLWEVGRGQSLELARTAAVNAVLFGEAFYLFNMRSFRDSVFSRDGLTGNRYVWFAIGLMVIAQLVFTYAPFMQTLFGTAGLDLATWLRVLAFGIVVLIVVELEKLVVRLRTDPKDIV